MFEIIEAATSDQVSRVRSLFQEYADSLGFDLGFQQFAQELATLPGKYASPDGCLLLAWCEEQAVGCVAVRRLGKDLCEMKRLYVRPDWRGNGLGRSLAEAAVGTARRMGYARMRLDTVAWMERARNLYESLGFVEIAPYYDNPLPGTAYMELDLAQ